MKMAGGAAWKKRGRWGGAPPAREEKERMGRASAALIVCLMTLPFLVFLLAGRERASTVWQSAGAKLTTITGGFTNASRASTSGSTEADDELLGGLLSPGFDRASCLSRYQSWQYYKHSPYAPSSYLLRRLRAYEARHRRCAPGTAPYARAVEHLRSGGGTEAAMECNYLVWLPYNGLGNRMLSLVSTFVYALLTDRVLLLHTPADFADLFCEPFPDTTWVLPPDFPVANLSRLGLNPDQSYRNLLDGKKMVNDPAKATARSVPPYVFLNLGHEHRFMDTRFYCGADQRVLAKVNWLLVYSDLYLVPTLYSMAQFKGELRRLFPARESVAHLLGRYLFHPTNTVWGLVTRYYHSYLAQAEQRIGVQIRMFPFSTIPVDDMYNQILSCSRQERILPEVDGDDGQATETGADDRMKNGTSTTSSTTSKAILVASLYADYYERLRSTYYEHAARGGARVGVFQPSHEGVQATGRRSHNQKALAEVYLLSFSDALLTSGISTFGYVSSSLAGVRPTILRTAYGHKVPATPCVRAVSMEPCNLTPPRVSCPGYADRDKEDLARHVRRCEDERTGVKLFD